MRHPHRVVTLLAVPLLACTALSLRQRYVPMHGEALPTQQTTANGQPTEPIPVHVDGAPEGFAWIAGKPEVQTGYGHVLLGRVELHVQPGQCAQHESHVLGESAVFGRLRARARTAGGDAVVFVHTLARDEALSDCQRLAQAARRKDGTAVDTRLWAVGYVARLERPQAPAGVADGGLSDPDFDGGMPDSTAETDDALPRASPAALAIPSPPPALPPGPPPPDSALP